MIKAKQLINKKGNPAANQFVLYDGNTMYFQSYDTVIAKVEGRKLSLTNGALDYSKTTNKHLHIFLEDYAGINKTTAELRKDIKNGTITTF